jgi:hypothetical protein
MINYLPGETNSGVPWPAMTSTPGTRRRANPKSIIYTKSWRSYIPMFWFYKYFWQLIGGKIYDFDSNSTIKTSNRIKTLLFKKKTFLPKTDANNKNSRETTYIFLRLFLNTVKMQNWFHLLSARRSSFVQKRCFPALDRDEQSGGGKGRHSRCKSESILAFYLQFPVTFY